MPYANLYNEEVAKEVKKRNQKLIDHEKKQSETPSAEASAKHYKQHISQNEKPKDDVIELIKYVKSVPKKAKSKKAHADSDASDSEPKTKPKGKKKLQPESEPPKPKVKENRVDIVKRIMKQRGVSMIEASKIIKSEGLY